MLSYLKRSPLLCLFLALGILASCSPQRAHAETSVGVHLGSVHSQGHYNNVNPGVYVNHNGWTAGTYYNSERKQSVYGGYTFDKEIMGGVRSSATVGLITGYGHGAMPMVVPSISAHNALIGGRTRLSWAIKIKPDGAHALHLSHEWSF